MIRFKRCFVDDKHMKIHRLSCSSHKLQVHLEPRFSRTRRSSHIAQTFRSTPRQRQEIKASLIFIAIHKAVLPNVNNKTHSSKLFLKRKLHGNHIVYYSTRFTFVTRATDLHKLFHFNHRFGWGGLHGGFLCVSSCTFGQVRLMLFSLSVRQVTSLIVR